MIEKGIERYLANRSYECFYNVSLGGKIADLVAIKSNKITAFEFKKHATEIPLAIGHCLHYLNDSNKVYIVICSKEKDLIPYSTINILKNYGIGLMISDHEIEILIESKEFNKNNISIIKKIKENTIKSKIIYDKKHIKKYIIDILKEHSHGLTITNISKLTGLSRLTTSKYLAIMEVEKIVEFRKIGMAKLFKLKEDSNE